MSSQHETEKPNGAPANQRNEPDHSPVENALAALLEQRSLFSPTTPPGEDPVCYPADVMDHMLSELSMAASRQGPASQLATDWPAWQTSLKHLQAGYDFIVYPALDQAEERFRASPAAEDPAKHGPASYKSAINEAISDAIENPGVNTAEYPHRAPLTLSGAETDMLGRIVTARGLPFNPAKRVYSYAALAPLKEANARAFESSLNYTTIVENTQRAGILRPREEIEKEIRQRQEGWKTPKTSVSSPRTKPPRSKG